MNNTETDKISKELAEGTADLTERDLKSSDPVAVRIAEENIDFWKESDGEYDTPTEILKILRERGVID